MAGRRPRGASKPDFSDPGYGEIGCLFTGGGIVAGFVAAVVLSVFVPDPGTGSPDKTAQLLGVLAFGALAGMLAFVILATVVEHVPLLWRAADALVFAVPPVVAGAAVVAAVVTGPVAAIAVPVGLGGTMVLIVALLALAGAAWVGGRVRR